MALKIMNSFKLCASGGSCPTVHELESGDVLIQGYTLSAGERVVLEVPQGEDVVRIPRELLEKFVGHVKSTEPES